ncbi:Rid family hydrolase [Mycolicibacterium iranicum]|uniref:Enamine deaminase RidA n=1 Tax=Mycolicibacterium iranicum TaxID=912594 RepID=A0A178M258_MYCIR|nr:Rid family hydrolase [Mycolicibacterium iranicum]OAN41875.1 hypothetical protein A4X20_03300 [Mycolicibacterium iranicum]
MTSTGERRFEVFGFDVPWEHAVGYSQGLRTGDLVKVSGQLSHDLDGNVLHAGNFPAQLEATLGNLDRVLSNFGAHRSDVVEVNVYIVDLRANFDAAVAGLKWYFDDHRPTNTTVGVTALAFPQQLVEVAATAILPTQP